MRPLGFETPIARFTRSGLIGLVAGCGGVAIVSVPSILISGSVDPRLALFSFGLGAFAGFVLRLQWMEFAPPQPGSDGDAEAGVPARLTPPLRPQRASLTFPCREE